MKNVIKSIVAAASAMLTGLIFADTVTITVPANRIPADALYLVWGDSDKGGKLADWGDNAMLVAEEIPLEGGTYTAETTGIPDGAVIRALAVREVAFVESVEMSGGGQYFNTEVPSNLICGFEFGAQTTGPKSGGWASLISAQCDYVTVGSNYANDNILYIRYRSTEISFDQLKFNPGERNDLKILPPSVVLNGEDITSTLKETDAFTTTWVNETFKEITSDSSGHALCIGTNSDYSRWMSAKWYGAKIFGKDGVVIREYVPVEVAGNGYFYEKVTQRILGNTGSEGEFEAHGPASSTAVMSVRPAQVTRPVPSNATEVYAITFNAGAYIDTGYLASNETRLDFTVTVPAQNASYGYFTGALEKDSSQSGWWIGPGMVVANDPGEMYHVWGYNNGPSPQRIPAGRHEIDLEKGVITIDGELWSERVKRGFQLTQPLHIAGYNRGGSNCPSASHPMTFHAYKLWECGNLQRDYVPVRMADGTGTMYDRVSGTFAVVKGAAKVTPSPIAALDGMPIIDVRNADTTLTTTEVDELSRISDLAIVGRKTAWLSGTQFTLNSLTIRGGKLGFETIDAETLATLTLTGKLKVEQPLQIDVGEYLKAGTYTLLSAAEIEVAEGATITLSKTAKYGSGSTARELVVEGDTIKLVVTGDEIGVPDDWESVPFIESNGSQYLDTGYIHKSNTKIEITANLSSKQASPTGWAAMFGSRNWSGTQNAFIFFGTCDNTSGTNARAKWNRSGAETSVTNPGFVYDEKVTLVCEGQVASWTSVSGTTGSCTTTGTADDGVSTMFIFDLNKATTATGKTQDRSLSIMRLYAFKIYEGETLLHDYVPMRDPNGTLGMYDTLTGAFLTNLGNGKFTTAEGKAMYLGYLESGAGQYIDTGYIHTAETKIEAVAEVSTEQNSSTGWSAMFGARKWSYINNCFTFFPKTGYGNACYSRSGRENLFDNSTFMGVKTEFTAEGKTLAWSNERGAWAMESTGTIDGGVSPMFIFDLNKAQTPEERVRDNSTTNMKLYSLKISDENGVQRDYIPYRDEEGAIGLADTANNMKMYVSETTTSFNWGGLGYMPKGTVLEVYEGTMSATDCEGYTLVRKSGNGVVNAGAVANIPTLEILKGGFTLVNGTVGTLTVAEPVLVGAGVTLGFDLAAAGGDKLAAPEFDLSEVTPEEPITLELNGVDGFVLAPGARRQLLAAANGIDADPEMFVVKGLAAIIEVGEDGIYVTGKNIVDFRWVGNGANGDWSIAENWNDGDIPLFNLPLIFNVNKNTTTTMNIGSVTVASLLFGPEAGAFTHFGTDTLGIVSGISNESTKTQKLTMPLKLGAGEVFSINNVGALSLTGAMTVNAASVVKTGAGELTINPTVLAAPTVEITGGKVTLTASIDNTLTDAQSRGTITIAEGAQLDLNYPQDAGEESKVRESYSREKEIHIAGNGPDGTGALVNNGTGTTRWSHLIGNVVLDADATIGGTARTDSRGKGYTGGKITGAGKTLTVKNSYYNFGLNLYAAEVRVGKVVVDEGATLSSEGASNFAVPGGIELKNNAVLSLFGGSVSDFEEGGTFLKVAEGATATIRRQDWGASINMPVKVPATSTLKIEPNTGNQVIRFAFTQAIENEGKIIKQTRSRYGDAGATTWHLDGEYTGNGTIELKEGEISVGENFKPVVKLGGKEVSVNPFPALNIVCSTFEDREGYTETIASLVKQAKIVVTERAKRSQYDLGEAGSLTSEAVAEVAVTAEVAADAPEGTTTKQGWKLAVVNGRLVAKNPAPTGFTITVR